jgi:hypothetical protein
MNELHELFQENSALHYFANETLYNEESKSLDTYMSQKGQSVQAPETLEDYGQLQGVTSGEKDSNYFINVISQSIEELGESYRLCAEKRINLYLKVSKQMVELRHPPR